MTSPCKDCKRRKVGCHNVETCEPWRDYVERNKARLEGKCQANEASQDLRQHLWRHRYKRYDKLKG